MTAAPISHGCRYHVAPMFSIICRLEHSKYSSKSLIRLVGAVGIEPTTPSMSPRCSTAELSARIIEPAVFSNSLFYLLTSLSCQGRSIIGIIGNLEETAPFSSAFRSLTVHVRRFMWTKEHYHHFRTPKPSLPFEGSLANIFRTPSRPSSYLNDPRAERSLS